MNTIKRKILFLDSSTHFTGALKSIISISEHLHKEFDFYFGVTCSPFVKQHLSELTFNYYCIRFRELRKNVVSVLLYFPTLIGNTYKLSRLIKKQGISIVHVNDLYNMCGVLLKITHPSITLIYSIRLLPTSYGALLYPMWKKLILYFANEIVCVSEAVRRHWPEQKNIYVIYDFVVPPEKLPPKQISENSPCRFMYLANFMKGKGHDHAIRAFHKVLPMLPKDSKLQFIGSDMGLKKNIKYKLELMKLVSELGISTQIVFNDFVNEIEGVYKSADIFLNFSDGESFSMTCLEASYYGTPTIATACGGPSEIIEHNKTGILVEVANLEDMAAAMIRLSRDKKLQSLFSQSSKSHVRQVFNRDVQGKKFLDIYSC